MKKRIIKFSLIALILFAITYSVNLILLEKSDLETHLPVLGMYLYHSISGLIVYILIEVVFSRMPDQTGFAFLASVFLKIGFFILIFSSYIYSDSALLVQDKLTIVIPFFTFLLLEAFFSFKLLNEA